ncbi:complement receptor type 1-like isoform X2 [Mauremys reevesii]|uniref:complement receptor type 1-like isoform X2 n=1 Tax=Mauremys reevesii TaxID=260615 RepID=UPI00193FE4FF|nr:complement receptor type 1-like isoform X2 [Mauremys reevesii]
MVSAPRCPPGARGLLALLLLLLPLPGARGQCGAPPRLSRAIPYDTSRTEGFPIGTEVTYRCLDGFVKIPGKSDTVVCLSNSEWSAIGEFCSGGCGAPPRLKSATLSKKDGQKNYSPSGSTVSYVCRPGYESTQVKPVITCLENLRWSEAPEICRGKSCGVPKGPEHGRAVVLTNDLYGARANVICDEGFRLHGRTFIQCLLKGDQVEWSQLPTCQVVTCSPPPNVTNGMHNGSNVEIFVYNSSVTYKCDQGFSLIGEASIQCTTKYNINGVWNGSAPECKAIPCPPPPDITHGSLTGQSEQEFSFGSAVTYKCDQGFSLIGEASIHCTTKDNVNGEWSGPAPECKGQCGAPPSLSRASPHDTSCTEGCPIGTEVTYRCLNGFVKIPGKSDTVVCLSNSEWSTFGEFCNGSCGAPPRLKSATLSKEDGQKNYCPPGSTVSYVCRPGYESTEVKPVITCLENLTWSEAPEFCRAKSCGVPKGPEHGRAVVLTNDLYGARANIICDDRFRLCGRPFIQCLLKGDQVEWSQLPTCQAVTCSPPPNIANGTHNGSNVEIFVCNSSVTYKCDHNFLLTGEASIQCTTKDNINGVWNGSAPECKGTCDSPPRLSFAELPGVVNNSYPVGTELKYSCRPGYVLGSGKSPLVVCLANSTWSVDPEFCVGIPCKQLELENGRVHLKDRQVGATANFSCDEGYRLIGTTSTQCVVAENGVNWDKELPHCQGQCGALPMLSRASPQDTSCTEGCPIGTEVTYRCHDGFVKIPGKSDTVICLSNSEWSTFGEFCSAGCDAPPRLKSATLSKEDEQKNYSPTGSTVSYVCRPGYESTELKRVITCLENLTWSEAPEFCRGKSCGVPKGPEHGRAVVLTNDLYGARANIICDEGFRLHGRTFIQCLLKGDQVEWSQLPTCQAITCSPPPNIANGMHNGSNVEIFVCNSSVTYKCDHNFSLIGEASIQCTTKDNINGVWNGSAPECKAIPCLPPPDITSGSHTGQSEQEFSFGSAVTYKCDQGFSLIGEASIHCTTKDNVNGEWSWPAPECKAIPCLPPPDITSGSHTGQSEQEFSFGSAVTYKCDQGFSLIGEASIHCTTKDNVNGEWSWPAPECKAIPCLPPPDITSGSHTGQSEQEFSFGSAVTYKCDQGFSLIGEASIHCTTKDNINGEWSGPAPECKGICDSPPRLSFAELPATVNDSYPVGTKLKYSCRPGYVLGSGKSPLVVCLANSTWSVDPEFCVGRLCKQLELENGRVHLTDHQVGATANFSCDEGYRLIGTISAQCVVVGNGVNWDKRLPHCQAIPCLPPPDIANGSHTGQSEQEFSFGSAVTYKCDQGFSLIGEASIHCTTKDNVNGEWSGPAPECKAITCSPPPNIANGTHNGSNVEIFVCNSSVTYKCVHNFSLIGEASIHCTTKDNISGVWNGSVPECKDQCGAPRRLRRDTNGKELADRCGGGSVKSPEPGFDTRIGIPGIGSNITTVVGITVAAIAIAIVTGIVAGLNKKWKKKKGSYGVNLDSPKYHIAPEDDLQMSETKSNLIIKV